MPASETIRLGCVGAGWFASRRHLPDAQKTPGVAVTALCRRSPDQLARMAEHFGVTATYTDFEHMLDEADLDAVLVATPHDLHYHQVKAVLERGLHVLVEKPMTVEVAHAEKLVRMARERDRVLAVALNPPYWAYCHFVRETILSGKLGAMESVDIQYSGNARGVFGLEQLPANLPGVVPPTSFRSDPSANGGGFFIDGGSHLVAELLWNTGLQVDAVTAVLDPFPGDIRASVAGRLSNGAHFTIHGTVDTDFPAKRIRNSYLCSAGTVIVEGAPFVVKVTTADGETVATAESDMPPAPTPVADFAAAIRGESAPLGSPTLGLDTVRVVSSVYRAAEQGTLEFVR